MRTTDMADELFRGPETELPGWAAPSSFPTQACTRRMPDTLGIWMPQLWAYR